MNQPTHLEEVQQAWEDKEVTATQIAEKTGKSVAAVARALNGEIDPPYSVGESYWQALQDIRRERKSGAPIPVGD